MGAPVGNRFWEARSSHGRSPTFATPEDLASAAGEYFAWVEENPLYEDKAFAYQGDIKHDPVAKMRAMTISGLCIFLGIARRSWDDYRKREDYLPVTEMVEETIRTQKFEGASADLLNANIIARDLGLVDRSQTDLSAAIMTANVSELDIAQRIAHLLISGTSAITDVPAPPAIEDKS